MGFRGTIMLVCVHTSYAVFFGILNTLLTCLIITASLAQNWSANLCGIWIGENNGAQGTGHIDLDVDESTGG